MIEALLSVRDLKVHFPIGKGLLTGAKGAVKAVDGISFDLKPGETLGIVGESGCGKSTLGRAILRLTKPTDGTVVWLGQDFFALDKASLRKARRELQIIFQDPLASLDPRMTVGAIIARPLKTFHPELTRTQIDARVKEAMAQVGLAPEMMRRYPHEFSGGQCQRIGIARAMILRPKLIVCDEPVSALDVSIQAQIINLLRRLQRDLGLSLLFISHNLSVVRHISHRVMVLYLGKVMELAERDAFYANPMHPYSKALISAIPLPDPKAERARERVVLQGDLPSALNPPKGCRFCTRCPMATDLCHSTEPPLAPRSDGRLVACHFV
ncbi:MAG: oligopeptide ABC transporter ATP-binding protein OppF [Rhodospirillum sp.]|nr:oligopeptide ABC transporter ATP-binding protein OppF [Rhodospirillum sp.]